MKPLGPLPPSTMRHRSKPSHSGSTTPEQESQPSPMPPRADKVPEAPLPPGATPLPIRDINLPRLYEIPQHSQVLGEHGRIIMAVYDWRRPAMQQLFNYSAGLQPPGREEGAAERGICLFKPSVSFLSHTSIHQAYPS
jgi:hypothetical protein